MSGYEVVKAWREKKRAEGTLKQYRAADARQWRKNNPEVAKQIKRRYVEKNIDKIRIRDAEAQRKFRASNPEVQRERYARWRAKAENRLVEIAGRPRPSCCDICGNNKEKIVFDHCHKHGHFRGWICDRCNKTLGLLKDDPKLIRKMLKYLERTNGDENIDKKQTADLGLWNSGGT